MMSEKRRQMSQSRMRIGGWPLAWMNCAWIGFRKGKLKKAMMIKLIRPMVTDGVAAAGERGRLSMLVNPMAGLTAWGLGGCSTTLRSKHAPSEVRIGIALRARTGSARARY